MSEYTSMLGSISKLVRTLTNVIFFEFSKYDNVSKKNEGVYFTLLYTLPSEIHYTYPSRNKFLQTMGGGFLDKFPMGLPKIRMSGTFGKERRGLLYLDGLARLAMFKELMIKQYHKVKTGDAENTVNKIVRKYAGMLGKTYNIEKVMLKENEVYVLTMYDFINSETWVIDPTTFDITESARTQANLPRYDLRMQAVGKPLGGKFDETLQKVMSAKDIALLAANLAGTLSWSGRKEQAAGLWTSLSSCFK